MKCEKVVSRAAFLAVGLLLLAADPMSAQTSGQPSPPTPQPLPPPPAVYGAPYVQQPPVIDGDLGDPAWSKAPWTSAFVDIEGDRKPAPRFTTRAKMLWDDECLYIGAFLEEPHLMGTLRQRDTVIFYDNDFEVFIDPDGDCLRYMEFEMNALNTQWDLFLPKPYRGKGSADNSWDMTGLRTAVRLYGTINHSADVDSGWSVEIAMRWSDLHPGGVTGAPAAGDRWRINFSRVEWHFDITPAGYKKRPGLPEDNWVWSPQWAIDMHRPEFWGELIFLKDGMTVPPADPVLPAYAYLSRFWYAQTKFHETNGRYAGSAAELGLHPAPYEPRFRLTDTGYVIAVDVQAGDKTVTVSMDESSGMLRVVR